MTEMPLRGRALLVVEDEAFTRGIVQAILRDLGAQRIHAAADGAEALELLDAAAGDVDAALCDFNMPRMNGIDLLRAIRAGRTKVRRDLPFAMLTGNSDRALVDAAIGLDVTAFLVKPVAKRALAERLGRMLGERRRLTVMRSGGERAGCAAPTEQRTVDDLELDSVLARDIVVGGSKILAAGAVLGAAEIRRLRSFADLADLLGALPPIHVVRDARPRP